MKRIVFIFLIVLSFSAVNAQEYRTAIGIRGTFVSGITAKHFTKANTAIEGIAAFGGWGFSLTGLYEMYAPAFDVDRLYWYYGGGGHIGQWDTTFPGIDNDPDDNRVNIGFDGIIGLEYDIKEIPFTISLDWKPSINLTGYSGFWGYGAALSVRYTFGEPLRND